MNYDRAIGYANSKLQELLDKPKIGPSPMIYKEDATSDADKPGSL